MASKENYDILYKFILLGDSLVGKTCIFKKIINNKFDEFTVLTIGMDLKTLDYEIEIEEKEKIIKKKLKIKLYDTAGQERLRCLTKNYLNQNNGIIMVYDITNKESFDNVVTQWLKNIENEFGSCEKAKTCILLIGNKNDLVEGEEGKKLRNVKTEEAEKLAKDYRLIWGGECSAKNFTKEQFEEIIIKFAKIIYSKYGYKEPDKNNVALNRNVNKQNNDRCQC